MISTRKRKLVVKKLHAFFTTVGNVPSEAEYKIMGNVPFTTAQLQSYLGGYDRAVQYVKHYFPQWKEVEVVVKEAPSINLDALESDDD